MKGIVTSFAVVLACSVSLAFGAAEGKAQNKPLQELEKKLEKVREPEKREAIMHIRDLFREYNRHYAAMKIVDYIIEADRNASTLAGLAEYAITEGSATMAYIELAEQAAKAPRADTEFLQLAALEKKLGGGHGMMMKVAQEAARAKTDADLQAVREKIATLEKVKPSRVEEIYNPDPWRHLDRKMKIAQSEEKRKAIAHIRDLFKEYRRHFLTMDVVDFILEADRNVPILDRLAEYAITEGSATVVYVAIAEQAAEAPLADQEFLQLAEFVKRNQTGTPQVIALARQAAQAKTDAEVKEIQKKITELRK